MQTFMPPYLVGSPNRPVISALQDATWQYGEAYNVSVAWKDLPSLVDRAVLSRSGGVTHSVHFDARQVRAGFPG